MLDLIVSYIHFFIFVINYLIKILTFQPPKPPGYIIEKTINKKEIFFIEGNEKEYSYERKTFKDTEIEYIYLNNNKTLKSELLILKPKNHYQICIIYCHGNCGDLGYSLNEYYLISKYTNCLLLCFEYPGYGTLKKTKISESKLYLSIQKAYLYAKNILKFEPKNIFIYGFSLGTGIAFDLACKSEFPIGGLILQSPFLSIIRIIYNIRSTFFLDILTNCDKAKNIKTKVLFIHGVNDLVVPYIHGRILSKLIPEKYFYDFITVKDGGHNNLFRNKKDKMNIFRKIREFISACSGIEIKVNNDIYNYHDDNISYEGKSMNTLDKSIFTDNNNNKYNKKNFGHNKKIKSEINFSYKDDSVINFDNNSMTNNNNTEALTIENLCEKDKKRKMKFLGNKKGNNKFFDKIKINEEVKNDNNNFLNKSFTMFNITGKLYNYEIDKLKNNDNKV